MKTAGTNGMDTQNYGYRLKWRKQVVKSTYPGQRMQEGYMQVGQPVRLGKIFYYC